MYVHEHIFISTPNLSSDTFHTVQKGGEAKAMNKDVGNVAILGERDDGKVRFFMQVMVEVLGKRYLCQSIAPGILTGGEGQEYLEYGKVEVEGEFKAEEEVESVVKDTFGGMGMVGRWVEGKEIFGPIEMKGLKGHDGRRYFLEVPRLTPRDANWVPKSEGGTGNFEGIGGGDVPDTLNDGEWSAMVIRPELIEAYKENMMTEARDKVVTELKKEIKVVSDKFEKEIGEKIKEYKSQEEAGKDEEDEGKKKEAKEIREKELTEFVKAKQEENTKMREEKIKEANGKEKQALEDAKKKADEFKFNVNVFLNVKPDSRSEADWANDEANARSLADFAANVVVPKLTAAIRSRGGSGVPSDGEELTELLHAHGLNCRYLGALAREATKLGAGKPEGKGGRKIEDVGKEFAKTSVNVSGAWLDILEVEMCARAAKKALECYLRSHEDSGNKATLIASFLSALVTVGEETVGETDTREENEGVSYKGEEEGGEGGLGWEEVWEKIRKEVGRR